jgi:WD40 repeat protein
VLDILSGQRCFEYRSKFPDDAIGALAALSPDGRWLAWVNGTYGSPQRKQLLLFDVDAKKQVRILTHPGNVAMPVWHPDGRTLAIGNTDTNDLYVWDAIAGKRLHTLDDQKGGAPVLRRPLAGLGLDWGQTPLPPPTQGTRRLPLVVTVKPIDPTVRPVVLSTVDRAGNLQALRQAGRMTARPGMRRVR